MSLFVLGIIYFVLVIRTFRVWSSIGAMPLRVGEGEHADDHHDHVTTFVPAPPGRGVLGGTGKLGVVLETKEGGSSQIPGLSDQHMDTDEKHLGRSPGKGDTTQAEGKGETSSEKRRWWGKFSSDNLAEGAEKVAFIGALDLPVEMELDSRRTVEGSSDPLHSAEASSTPASALGVSLHG